MKRIAAFIVVVLLGVAGWATYQGVAQSPSASLARLMPQDAVLFLEARDFRAALSDWNSSPQKQLWLNTDNHEVFSRSRLFLRLQQAQDEFAAAAGLTPDMSFLGDVAGEQSALALYDIGKLQFLYVTHLPSARAMQSGIWQQRGKFETREINGKQFYVRTDPQSQRVAAFAIADDYLILATREDLVAGALSLLANQKTSALSQQGWFVDVIQAAKEPGELRLVVHLAEVAKTPQFRTYWVQQNITEMRQYESSVSDLFRSAATYREERVLLVKDRPDGSPDTADASSQVSELMRLIPPETGFYRASALPTVDDTLALLEQKVLAPRLGPTPDSRSAPDAPSVGQPTGGETNLDVRIDVPPSTGATPSSGDGALKALVKQANVRAALQLHGSQAEADGIFVRLHSTIVLRADADWDEASVQQAIQRMIAPGLTASTLGVQWKKAGVGQAYSELDGLARIALAVRGKYLLVSNDPATLAAVLARFSQPVSAESAIYYAGFDHARERQNFYRLTSVIDQPSRTSAANNESREPQFFSQNVTSLSQTLAAVKSQSIVAKRKGGVESQTVLYEWAR
ncbi:MAG: hypothetical protein ABSD13_12455 [Candidatus Korobacteraceae bacterium]|jgi:hypothetical protein